jgi:cyclopropane fatty-acyl-phospholipid synthase-like methyltransferase
MDIGCSGGAFVRDCLEDGHLAIGLEGSDYSLVRKRAEWATIPDNLFTCDVTKPFEVLEDGKLAIFNIISAWEVMEHIKEEDLTGLCQNVRRHLHRDGYWIMSVSEQQGEHHVCVHGPEWWKNLMGRGGFENVSERVTYFGDDWIRGPKQNAPQSFHLILKAKP